ncbi:hypothetical protein BD324DRAFT_627208 [Kockovaella imperatae]|uniref:RanBD1 domain-containing protein n=1 Tax=Kockovaella imperatae TaxID=4999 RepID=A0A1Y1UFG3_9TREE|nr:hypothetical protein BD324DRAFT_627208 [Kockovaella imperatae]ORX36801.1 hypothetical protein BD324DRAFT_627208 [Kockovaella imperatae]
MAKRTAENQKTKDDQESDGEDVGEPGVRDIPLAPVEGRKIRGLPKRGGQSAVPAPVHALTPSGINMLGSKPEGQYEFPYTASAAPSSTGSSSTSAPAPFSFGSSTQSNAFGPSSASTSSSFGSKPTSSSPFSGFSFGQPAKPAGATTSPFTFGASKPESTASAAPPSSTTTSNTELAPSSTPAPAPPKPFAGFSFGASTATPPQPMASASTPAPPFGATASTTLAAPKPVETPKSSAPVASLPTPPPEEEVSYFTSIRGLNVAILSFLTSTLESDPFVDLSNVFPSLGEQYKKHLDTTVGSGWRPPISSKPPAAKQGDGSAAATANGSSAPSAPSMPTVGTFSLPKPATSAPAPAPGGFTFTPSASSSSSANSPFKFPAFVPPPSVSTPAETPKKQTSSEASKIVQNVIDSTAEEKENDTPAPKPFTFGAPSHSTTQDGASKSTPLFSFAPSGPLHPPTPGAESFTPSKNIESASTGASPAKLGKFGPGGSKPQLSFGGASAGPSTPGKPVGFQFGGNSTPSAGFSIGSSNGSAAPSSSAPSFSFGGKPATSSGSAFSFGSGASTAPATNGSSSASFSFGASKPAFSFGTAAPTDASKPAFSFGAPSSSSASKESGEGAADSIEPGSETQAGEVAEGSTTNLANAVGAGEEDEETVYEKRTKLHQLVDGKYEVRGLGVIRLKRAKQVVDGGKIKRRLLMRSDGGGAIVLNMTVSDKFDPSAEGKMIKFVGFDLQGKPTMYALQVKTQESAEEFVDEMKKEVEAIKRE